MSTRTRPLLAVLAAAAMALLGLFLAPAASAHDQLVSSNPKDGATLDKQPEWLEMTFSGNIQDVGTEIKVEHGGKDVNAGEYDIKGKTVKSALPDDLAAGDYTVKWRVVSQDGHPISGDFGFTISDKGGAGGAVSSEDSSGEAGLGAGAVDQPDENAEDTRGDLAAGNDGTGMSAPMVILLVVGGIAIVAVVVILLLRKNRGLDSGGASARSIREGRDGAAPEDPAGGPKA
ncbi:copper resistance CopC family protein [Brevibacterium rongguiense]|nr:copper resistance CopC family protein [Brevibacterium rongguiense]